MLSNYMFMSSRRRRRRRLFSRLWFNNAINHLNNQTSLFFQCPGVIVTFAFPVTEHMPASVHDNELHLRCALWCATYRARCQCNYVV